MSLCLERVFAIAIANSVPRSHGANATLYVCACLCTWTHEIIKKKCRRRRKKKDLILRCVEIIFCSVTFLLDMFDCFVASIWIRMSWWVLEKSLSWLENRAIKFIQRTYYEIVCVCVCFCVVFSGVIMVIDWPLSPKLPISHNRIYCSSFQPFQRQFALIEKEKREKKNKPRTSTFAQVERPIEWNVYFFCCV